MLRANEPHNDFVDYPGTLRTVFDALTITLRELAELALIFGAMRACLRQSGHSPMTALFVLGGGLGLVLGAVAGELFLKAGPGETVIAIVTIVLTAGVALVATRMLSSQRIISARVEAALDLWLDKPQAGLAIAAFAAVVTFREVFELRIFLAAIADEDSPLEWIEGMGLGIVCFALVVVAWRMLELRVGILAAFRLSTVLLVLLSIQLALESVRDLLTIHAAFATDSSWREAALSVLPDGRWYALTCLVLMVPALFGIFRSWWREATRR